MSKFRFQLLVRKSKVVGKGKKKKTKYFFEPLALDKFKKGRYYRIYLVHKETRRRRLFGFGKFTAPPIFHRGKALATFMGKEKKLVQITKPLGGRTFDPTKIPKGKLKGWLPITRAIKAIEKEVLQFSKKKQLSFMGSVIPPKRLFHPHYLMFSDKVLSPNERLKGVGVSTLLSFSYPSNQWLGKQTVIIDLRPRGMMVKNLVKNKKRWEATIGRYMAANHPNADDVSVLSINGFVPLDFLPKAKEI